MKRLIIALLGLSLFAGCGGPPLFRRENRVVYRHRFLNSEGREHHHSIIIQRGGVGNGVSVPTGPDYDGYELGDTFPR